VTQTDMPEGQTSEKVCFVRMYVYRMLSIQQYFSVSDVTELLYFTYVDRANSYLSMSAET